MIGRITIDDVVDVIREEAGHSVLSMAGLKDEQDMFAPVITSARRRAVWLGINLLTAFLAAWVPSMALVGVGLPLLLAQGGVDPAIVGGVVLTTFTDCIGFAAFL